MWKKALVLILLTSMLLVPFTKATSYSVNYGREIAFYSDVTLQNSKDLYATGFYYSATQGSTQESPTRFDDDSQSGFYVNHLYVQWEVGKALGYIYLEDSDDKTVYDDEKVAFALMEDTDTQITFVRNTSAYMTTKDDIIAFWYLENPTIMTDYAYYHWYVDESDDAYFDINDPSTVTYTIHVVDEDGDPVTNNVKIYLDLVANDTAGITSTNEGLFFSILEDYFNDVYTTGASVSRLYFYPDQDGVTELKLPQYVYYGKEYSVVEKPYQFQLQAEWTASNGTTYTSNVVDIDTSIGNMDVTLVISADAGGGQPSDFIYVSFYYDENQQNPVYIGNYNISVVKAFSPDGLSMPSSHTYELYNYYTLKIPVDDNYPYAVVTLKDDQGNVAFKKGYVMQAGAYSEVLEGNKFLVKMQVYDTTNNTFVDEFKVLMKGESTDYVANTTTGSLTLNVLRGDYVVEIYDSNDNLLYSTILTVERNIDQTFYVRLGFIGKVELIFVDATLKPVYVGDALSRFVIVFKSGTYFVDVGGTTAFVYTEDKYFMNNRGYYYIYDNNELVVWQNGVDLVIYDKYSGIELRRYRYQLSGTTGQFMVMLPYVVSDPLVGEDSTLPPTTIPLYHTQPPEGTTEDEYRAGVVVSVFDWLFNQGMFIVLIILGVAFTAGDDLGRGAGIYLGLALALLFTYIGILDKAIGMLVSLGFAAILLRELNIHSHLPRGGSE